MKRKLAIGAVARPRYGVFNGVAGCGAENRTHDLYGAGKRPARAVQGSDRSGRAGRQQSSGCAIPPGVITARFLAEKDNPRADMVMGLAASSLLLFEKMSLLETYKPAGVDALKPAYRDSKEPYTWTGMDAFIGVICFNTAEAGKANIAAPTVMEGSDQAGIQGQAGDAASGVFRHRLSHGRLPGCRPWASRKAGSSWTACMKTSRSIPIPARRLACRRPSGERVAGIALDMRGASEKTKGAPLEVIVPKEGVGWDMEAVAIVKGTKKLAAAKKIADWSGDQGGE